MDSLNNKCACVCMCSIVIHVASFSCPVNLIRRDLLILVLSSAGA